MRVTNHIRDLGANAYGGIKVFAGSSHPELAEEIAAHLGLKLTGRDCIKFPNENIFWRLHESVRGQDVFLIQTLSSPVSDHIMELLIAIDCLRRDSAARITVVMPYMAYARSDKKDQPRVPITARLLADMIVTAGADRYITVDLHAGQIQGFFSIPADLGFAKKGRNFAAKLNLPMAFVEKRRTGNDAQSEVLSVIGEVDGCNVVIVDDEISTAGSIENTVKTVKKAGARDVYVCATHGVFVGPAIERLRVLPIKEIVITNTVPPTPERLLPNMKYLSVGPLLGEVISRVHQGRSVGEMFNE